VKSNIKDNDIIELNTDKVIMNDGSVLNNHQANITMFGASSTNEIQFKHKWISRIQFIIISDVI
jgi:hypothetical protein